MQRGFAKKPPDMQKWIIYLIQKQARQEEHRSINNKQKRGTNYKMPDQNFIISIANGVLME